MPDVEHHSPIQPKEEHSREPSLESIDSLPDGEHDDAIDPPSDHLLANAPVKRKGGRKPIYATSEERKQRNRQAQAAFRERRTEYIKQLEATIKQQDDTLRDLQQSHRSAADECLMLRYKNSLLERILLEKGVDVENELRRKEIPLTGKTTPSLPHQLPVQRVPANRHRIQPNRPSSSSGHQPLLQKTAISHSPQLQPTPPSHASSSPTAARSPPTAFAMNPPSQSFKPNLQVQPQMRAAPSSSVVSSPGLGRGLQSIAPSPNQGPPGSAGHRPSHWPSPYQTHIEQLEQEYDAHTDMMDDDAEDQPAGPGPYPQQYPPNLLQQQQQQQQQQRIPQTQQFAVSQVQDFSPTTAGGPVGAQAFDPYDPMLDADPFGLTASMHFPTQFSFQESSMRK